MVELTTEAIEESFAEGDDPPELARARAVAHLLDDAIQVPGTDIRIGIDPIVGVLPVSGDLVASAGSLYIVFQGARLGVPRDAIAKMLALIAVDTVVGSIPVLGTIFDAAWKANSWNASIIEEHVRDEHEGTDAESDGSPP